MAAKMTLIRCLVRLAGNVAHVVPPSDRGFGPGVVSWPEAVLLREIHANDALEGIERVGTASTTPRAEKARLTMIYGAAVPEALFPGATPLMELVMPEGFETAGADADAEAETQGMAGVPTFTLDADANAAPTPGLGDLLGDEPGPDDDGVPSDDDDEADPSVSPSPELADRQPAARRAARARSAE